MSQQPVIPFFKTHTSIGKSLLRIKDVFRLAQENKLALVTLIEDSMIGFPEALRLSKKTGIKLVFGIRFDVCNDLSDPKEKIENSRSKMIAIMRNDEGYKDLISLYSEVHTNEYDCTDYKNLAHYFTDCQDTLLFGLPFYDSFIAKNSLTTSDCLPQFGNYKPFLCVEENGHPFDDIIKARLTHYQYIHGNRVQPCKSIYYENYQDFDAYTTYRLICGRSVYGNASLDRPNLPYFFSNRFCFEDWKNNTHQEVETYVRFEDSSLKGKKLVVFDTETEGLNLHSSKPWQIAWVEMLNGKVVNKEMHYLAWDDINVSKEAAAVTGFDINVYNAKKEDPKLIIEKFWKLISDPNVVVVGQNVLGFDIFMLEEVRRLVGLPTDFSYLSRVCDTVSLSRAYLCGIAKSPEESMVEFCFKMLNYKPEKRISVKLNKMLAHFGIDYDESKLHDALVDTEMTAELALRLLRVLGFEENPPFSLSVSSVKTPECTPIFRDTDRYETPMLEGVILPTADIPAEEAEALGLPSTCTSLEFLRALCNDGFKRIGIDQYPNFDDYKKRLDYELQVLDACGFVDYMLLNREIIQHCKQVGIPTGKGRGSAAGSLVFYLLDVTRVDPLKYGLIFERFVSMARAKKIQGKDGRTYLDGGLLADCDLDISYADRPKVVDFVFERFNGNACKILTVGTLSGKLCIKECMKLVGGFAEEDTKPVSDMIPKQYGVVKPLKEAYESSEDFKKFCDDNRKVFDIALRLEDLNKNTGVHPSGIAISAFPLKETMPLQLTKDGDLVSSFEMADVASIMVKFDLLGLRTLTQIKATCDMLGMDYTKLDYTNPEIYKFINKDIIPKGIFQIEADTNLKVAMAVKPENLEELSDVVALARPGTLAYLGDYVKAKETGEMRHSGDEGMDSLLHETKGLLLFQETLMMISHKVFGFTLEESEMLRKVVGKKKVDQMPAFESKIMEGAEKNGVSREAALYFWQVCQESANYSFNKSHSLCYAATAAETVYLKYWFPKEFYCSLLEQATAEPDPFAEIEKITQELPNFGIRLLPPDLANSELAFSIEGNDIRYGLGSIKGVSSQTFQKIVNFRNETQRDICDIYTSAKRAGLSIGVLSSFAQAGLFDSFLNGKRRCYLVYMLQTINAITPRQREAVFAIYKYRHQTDPNVDLMQIILECAKNGSVDSNGRILFRGGIEPVQGKIFKFRAIYDQNSKMPDFADWFYEKKVLGYSYSQSVKDLFEEDNARLIDSIEFQQLPNNAKVKVVGWVGEEVSEGKSRKNNSKYWRFSINDDNGNITCLMMDVKTRSYTRESLTKYLNEGGKKPSKGNIISIVGSKSNDVIFVNSLAIVEEKIYTRFSELKDEDASKP
jgi:DNA-directed DNA polymerase III PolC